MPIITGIGDVSPGLTMPTQHIYIQLADPWTTADYTDITPLVKQWSGDVRGRQHELQLFQPGQVALTLESNLNQGRFNTWNTNSPYYNLLSPDDAAFIASVGTWAVGSFAALPTGKQIDTSLYALKVNYGTGGPHHVITDSAGVTGNGYSVVGGQFYSIMGSVLGDATTIANVGTLQWQMYIQWIDVNGNQISTSASSPALTENATTWQKTSLLGVQAPSNAAFAQLWWKSVSTIAGASTQYFSWFSRNALFNYTGNVPNTAWAPGQRGLVPGRPMYATATWGGVTYPVWSMYTSNFTPAYGQAKSEQVINCADGMAILALGDISFSPYQTQVLADGALNFWRFADAPGSLTVADYGPSNNPLTANGLTFGVQSPIPTDDATVADFGAVYSCAYYTPGINPGSGAGSLSINFAMATPPTNPGVGESILFECPNIANAAYQWGSVFVNTAGNVGVNSYGSSTGGGILADTTVSVTDGNWHNVTVTWSAATSGTVNLYIDGVLKATQAVTAGYGCGLFAASAPFKMGNQVLGTIFGGSGQLFQFTGAMADVAYFPTALSAAAVANEWQLFLNGFNVQYSGSRITTILNGIGWPTSLQNIATGISLVQAPTSPLTQTTALSYCQTIESTELGALFCDPNGILTFYDRHYTSTSSLANTSQATFSNKNAATSTVTTFNVVQWIQNQGYQSGVGVASVTLVVPHNTTVGNSVLLFVNNTTANGGTPTSVIDTKGNVWHHDYTTKSTGTPSLNVYRATITNQLVIGDQIIMSGASGTWTMTAIEYANIANVDSISGGQYGDSGAGFVSVLAPVQDDIYIAALATAVEDTTITGYIGVGALSTVRQTENDATANASIVIVDYNPFDQVIQESTWTSNSEVNENVLLAYIPTSTTVTSPVFRYQPGLVPAMDDTDLWNDVPGQRNSGVMQRSSNALSISQYGRRTLTGYTGQVSTTDAEVVGQTQWLLQMYHIPFTRCRAITLSSVSNNGANLAQMLGRNIFDQVTLIWNPIDGSTSYFNQSSLIESIHHDVTMQEWKTTFGLSPAEVQTQYMILNNATLGQLSTSNRLAY